MRNDQFARVFDRQQPLMRRNELDQPFRERRLSRAGSARNQDILAALDRLLEKFDVLSCVEQIAQFNIERRDLPSCDLCLAKQPTELRSEEHTSELQSLMRISYAVFCLKKKNTPAIYTLMTSN